jgi:tetratricopeptide (TPR) repeat protein
MQYKDVRKSAPEIARELNVDTIVEGTVFSDGEQVRITTQLIRAKDDKHLWTNQYEYDLKDIFNLQKEVAQAIASEINVRLTKQEKIRLASVRRVEPETYQLYLRGRYHWNQRSEEGILKAIEYFDLAIEKDPDYAAAHAGLADCYVIAPAYYLLLPREAYSKARFAAMKALEIDNNLPEAYTSLAAVLHNYDRSWPEAENMYQKAIGLNPNYATAHQWYAELLFQQNRLDEALVEAQYAQKLDPLSSIIMANVGEVYLYKREYNLAAQKYNEALMLNPSFALVYNRLSIVYSLMGMHKRAIAVAEKAGSLSDNLYYTTQLGYIYRMAGEKDKAAEALEDMRQISEDELIQHAGPLVVLYIGLKDYDQAFSWAEKAYEEHDYWIMRAKVSPLFDPVRSDPRFIELLKKIGLDK